MGDNKDLQIERTFKASIELIWDMWTKSEHFSNWYGPTGCKIPKAEMDVKVGGGRHITMEMQTPKGEMKMHFVGEYLEIEPKTRLVYTETMGNEDGTPKTASQMNMPEGTKMETSVIVELQDLGGETKMTMTHQGVPADSPGAKGWEMAIGKMEQRVATLS